MFAPILLVDGETVTPEGWMWVLAFALGGAQWAIDECQKPEFDLRGKVHSYFKRKKVYELDNMIKFYEGMIKQLKRERESCSISIQTSSSAS
jgi:hypothetical protein